MGEKRITIKFFYVDTDNYHNKFKNFISFKWKIFLMEDFCS